MTLSKGRTAQNVNVLQALSTFDFLSTVDSLACQLMKYSSMKPVFRFPFRKWKCLKISR